MPVAYDIYSNQKGPADIVGGLSQGMKIGDMIRNRKLQDEELGRQSKIRDWFKQNTSKDGQINLNSLGGLAELSPETALKFQQMRSQEEDRALDRRYKNAMIGKTESETQKSNTPAAKIARDLTPGEKKGDEDYAQEYNAFMKSKPIVMNDMKKLEKSLSSLEKNSDLTGTLAKKLTGGSENKIKLFDSKAVATAQNIKSVLYKSLRTTFGAQLSDGERTAMVETAWDYSLPVEDNMDKVNNMIADIKMGLKSGESRANYFRKNGTLKGYKGEDFSVDDLKGKYMTSGSGAESGDMPGINNAYAGGQNIFTKNQSHPQSQEALEWAKQNPNTPEAAEILKRLGAQ